MTIKHAVPAEWLVKVVDCVRAHGDSVDEQRLYAQLGCACTEHTESLILGHPSLHSHMGTIVFRPFALVRNQAELLHLLEGRHPACYRRVDLRGLYAFVDEDISELLFRQELRVIDVVNETLSVAKAKYTLSAEFIALWKRMSERAHDMGADAPTATDARKG